MIEILKKTYDSSSKNTWKSNFKGVLHEREIHVVNLLTLCQWQIKRISISLMMFVLTYKSELENEVIKRWRWNSCEINPRERICLCSDQQGLIMQNTTTAFNTSFFMIFLLNEISESEKFKSVIVL